MRLRFSRFLKKLLRHGLLPQGQVGWVWGIPIRPAVTEFPLERANDVLVDLAADRIDGTALLVP